MLVQKKTCFCLLTGLFLAVSVHSGGGVVSAAEYYVAVSAPGGGNGSVGSPWNSVSQVNSARSSFVAGDHIYFKRGDTFRGVSLLINGVSGTAVAPIVFGSYDTGALPVIDGSDKDASWVSLGNDIYSSDFIGTGTNNEDPFMLVVDGTPKPPVTTIKLNSLPPELAGNSVLIQESPFSSFWVKGVSAVDSTATGYDLAQNKIETGGSLSLRYVDNGKEEALPGTLDVIAVMTTGVEATVGLTGNGDWYWDKEHTTIYLYSTAVPTDDSVKVNLQADGIRVDNSSYVHVQDIKVQNFNKQGVVLYLSSNITVDGVEVYACGKTGIQVWDASNNTITNNSINSVSGAISLWVLGNGTAENNQISNNVITNCFGACIGLTSHKVLNNTVSGNTISGANSMSYDGAGVYTFNAGSNLIASNSIHDCGTMYLRSAGIMVDVESGASTAPMTIVGNSISNNSTAGIAVSGASHRIHRNTLVDNGMESMTGRAQLQFFSSGRPASYCTVTSNVIEASEVRQFLIAEKGSTTGHYIDYNCYCGQSSKQFSWAGEWMTFSSWQDKTRHDGNSVLNGAMPPLQPLMPPLMPPTILQFIPAIMAGACK